MNLIEDLFDAYPVASPTILVMLVVAGILAPVMFLRRYKREAKMQHALDIVNIVDRIISTCDRKRQEITGSEPINMVYYIHGKIPGHRIIWARMSVREKSTTITVECASGANTTLIYFAEEVLAALRAESRVSAEIRLHAFQPEEQVSMPAHTRRAPSTA